MRDEESSFVGATRAAEGTDRAPAGVWLETPEGRATFDRIAAIAARATGARIGAVTLAEGAEHVLVGFSGDIPQLASQRTFPLRGSFLERLLDRGAAMAVADARVDPEMHGVEGIDHLGLVACAGAPVVDHEGAIVGAVVALDYEAREWHVEGLATLDDLAEAVAAALAPRAGGPISRAETRLVAAHTHVIEAIAFGEPLGLTLAGIVAALREYLDGEPVSVCVAGAHGAQPDELVGATGEVERLAVDLLSTGGSILGRLTVWGSTPRSSLAPGIEGKIRAFASLARIAVERSREPDEPTDASLRLADAHALARLSSFCWDRHSDGIEMAANLRTLLGDDARLPATLEELVSGWIAEEDRGAFSAGLADALDSGATEYRTEFAIDRPDGSRAVVAATCQIERDARGEPTGAFGVAQDVTERRTPGNHLDRALREATVGTAVIAPGGAIAAADSTVCALLGTPKTAVEGRQLHDVFFTGDRERLQTLTRRPDSSDASAIRLQRPDGSVTWAYVRLTALPSRPDHQLLVVRAGRKPVARADGRQWRQDRVTGLLDRYAFIELLVGALAAADSTTPRLGVLAIGLDRFKAVSESLGHAAGDEALVVVARRLADAVRDEDILARFDGDQFVVLFTDAYSASEGEEL
ncbi:MAG: hypothetical protein QOH46_7, partial [Solirubrobacteraceae bacterium]|nr:hypothetical protein [Solirubrobacteraceae bacterium]